MSCSMKCDAPRLSAAITNRADIMCVAAPAAVGRKATSRVAAGDLAASCPVEAARQTTSHVVTIRHVETESTEARSAQEKLDKLQAFFRHTPVTSVSVEGPAAVVTLKSHTLYFGSVVGRLPSRECRLLSGMVLAEVGKQRTVDVSPNRLFGTELRVLV